MGIGRIVHSYPANQAPGLLPIFSNTGSYMIFFGRILFGLAVNRMAAVQNLSSIIIYTDFWELCFLDR